MNAPNAKAPTISVIVTNYNYRGYVGRAVDSALAQDVRPREVVVVDDGSTDGSVEFLQQRYADNPMARFIATANQGQLAAFREGLKHCTGDVVCLLDADDFWDADYLSQVQEAFCAQPSVDFLFTNMKYFGKREGFTETRMTDRDFGISAILASFRPSYIGGPTSALSIKRALLARILDLPAEFDAEWKTCADTVLVLGASILGAHKYYLGTPRVNYQVHDANNWFDHRRGRVDQLRHVLRTERITKFYRERAGLDKISEEWAHLEFKTRPNPNTQELMIYIWLQFASRQPMANKVWDVASMLKHYVRSRF